MLGKSANTAEKQALLTELEDFIDEVSGMYDYEVSESKLELVNPPENKRSYSSIWGGNAIGTGHARSMLDISRIVNYIILTTQFRFW